MENKNSIRPKGSAKKVFDEFWKEAQKDNCDRKTLASIAFDAGHSLRHIEEDKLTKQLLTNLEVINFVMMVDDFSKDAMSPIYKKSKDLELKEKYNKIQDKIKKFSDKLNVEESEKMVLNEAKEKLKQKEYEKSL